MNNNSSVIISLCSHLCVGEGVSPLEPAEWTYISKMLIQNNKEPQDIINFSNCDFESYLMYNETQIERIKRLLNRSGSLTFEIEKLLSMGIKIVTRADNDYPYRLRKKLGQNCPPLFYYTGDINILKDNFIGMVGSRDINDEDIDFTKTIIKNSVESEFSIVSGGAKGIDTIASQTALALGGVAVEFLSDSLLKKIKDSQVVKNIRNGRLLLMSANNPSAGFNVGLAMQRNKYIYAQSKGTIIVKSDLNKGGTWAGATENLKHNWCHEFCWNNKKYKGNIELISKGAMPINFDFDPKLANEEIIKEPKYIQTTFFD